MPSDLQRGAEQLVAGLSAGGVSTAVLYPLDTLKTRLQLWKKQPERKAAGVGTFQSLTAAIGQDGARGLFKGVNAALLGSTLSWGLWFALYDSAKQRWLALGDGRSTLTALPALAAGFEAGVMTLMATHPIWLIKTRLQVAETPYTGFIDCARRIVRDEGLISLYKGFRPALVLTSHGAFQFMAYEQMRAAALDAQMDITSTPIVMAMGAASKLFASTVTYPYQVIKTHMMTDVRAGKHALFEATKALYAQQGIQAFYRGLAVNSMRVVPASALTFAVYERVSKAFRERHEAEEEEG